MADQIFDSRVSSAFGIKITYTGTPSDSNSFDIAPGYGVIPLSPGGAQIDIGSDLSPCIQNVEFLDQGNPGITAMSFDNLKALGGSSNVFNTTSLISLQFPLLEAAAGLSLTLPNVTTLDLSSLKYGTVTAPSITCDSLISLDLHSLQFAAGGDIIISGTSLTSINLSSLTHIFSGLNISSCPVLPTLSVNALTKMTSGGGLKLDSDTLLTSASFTSLTDISSPSGLTAALISNCPALTSVNFPAMVNWGSKIDFHTGNGAIATATLGAIGTTLSILGDIDLSVNNLSSAQVNSILALLVSLNGAGGTTLYGAGKTVSLNGGTNGAPSGQGVADKATLVGRGVTVNTN